MTSSSPQLPELSGAQRTYLRSIGQTTADGAFLGRGGITPEFLADFGGRLTSLELVKLRFTGGQDRHERAELCTALAAAAGCLCVGTVGHTALFWRPGPDGSRLLQS